MTRSEEPRPCKFRRRLDRIIELRAPQFSSVTDLGLQAGLAKGTLTNGLKAAEKAGTEPVFEVSTLRAVAGLARVSLSWLEGTGKDENAIDIPPPPEVSPLEVARRRIGGENSELSRLRAEVKELQRALKQAQKR